MRTNRYKSDEFALIGVYCILVYTFIMHIFRAVAIFGYVDFKFYLKKVGRKISLHTWFIYYKHL